MYFIRFIRPGICNIHNSKKFNKITIYTSNTPYQTFTNIFLNFKLKYFNFAKENKITLAS